MFADNLRCYTVIGYFGKAVMNRARKLLLCVKNEAETALEAGKGVGLEVNVG
jgi:hypothetical protein